MEKMFEKIEEMKKKNKKKRQKLEKPKNIRSENPEKTYLKNSSKKEKTRTGPDP
jgi:hypothetical protein